MHLGRVVILGAPNVGKSALFNRLIGRTAAIVFDRPGVTRDCHEGKRQQNGHSITFVDTPGTLALRRSAQEMQRATSASELEIAIQHQIIKNAEEADLILYVVAGTFSEEMFDQARAFGKRIIFVVNKSDVAYDDRVYAVGMDPVFISAEHGIGMIELWESINQSLQHSFVETGSRPRLLDTKPSSDIPMFVEEERRGKSSKGSELPIKISVIGRPNVGKSTLVNALLNRNVQVIANVPGTTRDTIEYEHERNSQAFLISDTAGMRRRAKVDDLLEKISVSRAVHSVNFSHVCILVIDAQEVEGSDFKEFVKQDLLLASNALEEGRCIVIALNKWDLVKEKRLLRLNVQEAIQHTGFRHASIIPISAQKRFGLSELFEAAVRAEKDWNLRLPTAKLNKWLRDLVAQTPPPASAMRRSKLKYMTQTGTRPLQFVIFGTKMSNVPASYRQFLENRLRQTFKLNSVPIRIAWRQQENPYRERQ
jgi:GTP-binding protein